MSETSTSSIIEARLTIRELTVEFPYQQSYSPAVVGVGYGVASGETIGIVGESGSGKSVSVLAATGLLPKSARARVSGSVEFGGRDILAMPDASRRQLLGRDISMIFQDPLSALNPVMTVGKQLIEALTTHDRSLSKPETRERASALLSRVGIPKAAERLVQYPHELSGGMRQRVMIAMAMANRPKVLFADEPTTALDVTVQAQIVSLIAEMRAEAGTSVVFITHDLGLVSEMADRVAVMYAGRVVEIGSRAQVLFSAVHPYTEGLIACRSIAVDRKIRLSAIPGQPPNPWNVPSGCAFRVRCPFSTAVCSEVRPELQDVGGGHFAACHHAVGRPTWPRLSAGDNGSLVQGKSAERAETLDGSGNGPSAILEAKALTKSFPIRRGVFGRTLATIRAVDQIDLNVNPGETVGIVGESGCGKSTAARLILGLDAPTSGVIELSGLNLARASRAVLKRLRSTVQLVFQDTLTSLNPAKSIVSIVSEPLDVHRNGNRQSRRKKAADVMGQVGLSRGLSDRRPSSLSGGQRQRVGIARAIVLAPKRVVLDEPVSSLDVSIRAQVLNLLCDLQQRMGLSFVFISHDLSIVRYMSDRIAVMYLGRIVELGSALQVSEDPQHPYTQALMSAIPRLSDEGISERKLIILEGELPSATQLPSGCRFRTRCWRAAEICTAAEPALLPVAEQTDHQVACHFPGSIVS